MLGEVTAPVRVLTCAVLCVWCVCSVTKGCDFVFNLAADMGGMGFIESNQSVLMFNNTMVSSNCLEVKHHLHKHTHRVQGLPHLQPP